MTRTCSEVGHDEYDIRLARRISSKPFTPSTTCTTTRFRQHGDHVGPPFIKRNHDPRLAVSRRSQQGKHSWYGSRSQYRMSAKQTLNSHLLQSRSFIKRQTMYFLLMYLLIPSRNICYPIRLRHHTQGRKRTKCVCMNIKVLS
jgi:hypothetical protein